MNAYALIWGGSIMAGVTGVVTAAYALRAYFWRRANTPLAIEAAPVRLAIEATPADVDEVREPSYLDACAQVLYLDVEAPEYHGLDRDDETDADAWIADLERAGYSVIRGQVALDRAYARMINEEFEQFDRATTEACNRVRAVGSREIIEWANEWTAYRQLHEVEVATIEIQGIREWIDNELAGELARSMVAELDDAELAEMH